MFRTVPLSFIRSFSLYTQQWYMSYRFADSLLPTCMTYDSCWRTEDLSETCRVLFQYIWEISASSWFYYKTLWRCAVTWTSKLSLVDRHILWCFPTKVSTYPSYRACTFLSVIPQHTLSFRQVKLQFPHLRHYCHWWRDLKTEVVRFRVTVMFR
jgi:hypothetical protein